MSTSHNVLVITSLDVQTEGNHQLMWFKGTMNTDLQFHCSITGNKIASVKIFAESTAYSQDEVLRKVIENFLNGRCQVGEFKLYGFNTKSSIDRKSIHHIDYHQMPEPWRSLFRDLFDASQWHVPARITFPEKLIE